MYNDGYKVGNLHEHFAQMKTNEKRRSSVGVSPPLAGFERVVWAPDSVLGYILGDIVDIGSETLSIKRRDNKQTIQAKHDDVFPADENLEKTVDDNCALMYLNEGTLLHNCHRRYQKKQIYTYVANILISINPYETQRGLYSNETIASYRGKSLGQMPPHIYALADKAYRDMRRTGESQSVIVSGESGAGKTESQKAVLKYLCENWGKEAGPIQQRLLETNPILEAFGNAKTTRNNNSSRFGKFVEIHFNNKHLVTGGFVSHYLLEKSRICTQTKGERNYHIFYQLIAGADEGMYKTFGLGSPEKFHYLRRGSMNFFARPGNENKILKERFAKGASTTIDPVVDDSADFRNLLSCLGKCGLNREMIMQVIGIVAAVLHLGNVDFVANEDGGKDGSKMAPGCEISCNFASRLLGIDEQQLKMALTSRAMQPSRGGTKGTLILVPLKPSEASAARDALAKAIYSRLFDWIVGAINRSIPFNNTNSYIGVLDIAGFEFFTINSFEQFCINYCNEKLQNFFNERILKQEQELYEKEGLGVEKITYVDNQDCIDLFERRGSGMLDLLDEEMRLPKPLPIHFTSAVHEANKKHFRLDTPRKSLLKEHRGMRDDDGLLVRHFAGTVCYETAQFIEKNNDALHASLEAIFETSNTPLIKELFEQSLESSVFSQNRGKKLVVPSVGSKFRSQLTVLLEKLNTTGTHFVRCVKPNSSMSAWIFEGSSVLSQLRCAGMGSVLKLMQSGYPSRTGFSELYNMYSPVLPPELARLDPRLFCKCLFHVLGLNNRDFKFGMTKVFFRPAKFAEFDQLLRRDPENMKVLVKKVKVWLITVRWRKAQYGAWSVIKLKNKILYRREQLTTIQKYLRGYLTRQKHAKRLALFRKSNGLQARGTEMKKIVDQLTPQSRQKWEIEVVESQRQLANLVQQCKNQRMEIDACARSYEECLRRVDKIIHDLKGQLASDEAIKLAEIEQKMREEREQEAKKQREEIMKEKEMEKNEMRRKEIEVERVRAERDFEKNRAVEASREIAAIEEMQRKRAREEQERLDAQLAARLAAEEGTLADLPASTSWNSSTSSGNNNQKRGKHDLSTWKYAELRDTINTSNDMELLLACKEEFHRRLRIYNEWKQKNASEKERVEEARRVPLALMNPQQTNDTMRWIGASGASRNSATLQVNPALSAQRFFKVPFSSRLQQNGKNPAVFFVETGSQQGVWYGHFNGQWIQRQIELHPDKPPILLLAGRDDLQMCELPLDQTQLPLKKGAEILEHEFETIWAHLGGKPLAKWNP